MTGLVQLAADWRGEIPAGGLMSEFKVDGWRAARFPGIDGITRLWTRNGLPIEGVDHILHRLALMEQAAGEPMMFDGEFQVGGTLAATKAWCERGWRTGGEAGTLYLFDAMPLSQWRAGGSDAPLYQRKARLAELALSVGSEPWEWREGSRGRDDRDCVQVLPDTWLLGARDVVQEMYRTVGPAHDGIMLKVADSPYRRTRSNAWAKVKPENQHKWRLAA